MKLSKLQALAEAGGKNMETNRRNWFKRASSFVDPLDKMITGDILKNLLKEGGFPATESKSTIAAWEKFQEEYLDLMMRMMVEFDMDQEDDPGDHEFR